MQFTFALLTTALVAFVSASPIAEPGPGPVCIPPTYGCGTSLFPKCCDPYTKKEIEARGKDFVCPSGTCGCGTKLAPKCCTLPPVGAACGLEMPPCCTCEYGKIVCDA